MRRIVLIFAFVGRFLKFIFYGNNRDKLAFWRKVSFYFNIIGPISIFVEFYFKHFFFPYRTVMSIYLIALLLIGVLASIMASIIKRKMNLDFKKVISKK